MNRFFFTLLFSFVTFLGAAQDIGNIFPTNLKFQNLQDGRSYSIESFTNKVVIVDFWATSCGPCITGLYHLDKWQKQLNPDVIVVAISEEKPERLRTYLKNRPNNLIMVSDTAGLFQQVFPYRSVPHTIVVGKDGIVKAITSGSSLSPDILKKFIAGKAVELPLKKDNLNDNINEVITGIFHPDTTLDQSYIVQPFVRGQSTMSKSYPNSRFENRRTTILNAPVSMLARLAHNVSSYRVKDEYSGKTPFAKLEKFCVDVWIEEKSPEKLLVYFQQQLGKTFVDLEIVKKKVKVEVAVLHAMPNVSSLLKSCDETSPRPDLINSLSYNPGCSSMEQLRAYLEDWGMLNSAVLDETGLKGNYRIALEFEPGKTNPLADELKKLGLFTTTETREIEMIMIKKK